ncbi:hypothetical protein GGR58DRAFT_485346 [Xylaria digitata]|nr:hypothetical protein GGR58DRAFT_485346 [Xylaria digitata]
MLQELKSDKEQELLDNFLATREAPQRAAEEAKALKSQTDKKWSDRKIGKITVPAHWIDKIMENIRVSSVLEIPLWRVHQRVQDSHY